MLRLSLCLILLSVALSGCANSVPRAHDTGIGAVQAVYVEVAPDIYVSERLLSVPPTRDYWVKLALNDDAEHTTMALVPAALRLAAGDQVAVDLDTQWGDDADTVERHRNRVRDRLSRGALTHIEARPQGDVIDRYLSANNNGAP